jgi:CRISPR-associated protein Cas1
MFKGRLGLDTARVPQKDRHGVLWLGRGNLVVDAGTLRFVTAGYDELPAGDYALPFQSVSCIALQPGATISHDALRLCARHGTGVIATGEAGVRLYASMPFGPDSSKRARRQVEEWSDEHRRTLVARRMYAWRLGELFPNAEIEVLRGMEGARMKATYKRLAEQFGLTWGGRRFDRENPENTNLANAAINHAAAAVYGLSLVAVAITGTIPQLGFIHEDSGHSFALDIADLVRDRVTLPIAFGAASKPRRPDDTIERVVRKYAVEVFRKERVVEMMIDRIKELFGGDESDDVGGDAQRS